jgi:hypothetical protein
MTGIPIIVCTAALPTALLAFGEHLDDPLCRFILKLFDIDMFMTSVAQLLELRR